VVVVVVVGPWLLLAAPVSSCAECEPAFATSGGSGRDSEYDSSGVIVQMVLAFLKWFWLCF